MQLELPVSSQHPSLIPDLGGDYPPYFIYGPLVFSPVTKQFTSGLTDGPESNGYTKWLLSLGNPIMARYSDKPLFNGEAMVAVTSPFFPHKLAKGYSEPYAEVLKTVNGITIRNLGHLVQVLRDAKDKYIIFDFDGRIGETLVFPRIETAASTDDILRDNGIRSQGSSDMMAIWNVTAAAK